MPQPRLDILNLTRAGLADFIRTELGEKAFRGDQLWKWLWRKGARSFADMTDVSAALRAELEKRAAIRWPETACKSVSQDGTVKLLLRLDDGEYIETVLIPEEEAGEGKGAEHGRGRRVTQCLSSQAGCAMGCTFCATGGLGFRRNLTQAEILGQILVGRAYLEAFSPGADLRNLVFMGMGEPLLNLENMLRSLESLRSEQGLNFPRRRVTVSTCGLPSRLSRLAGSGLACLALSLHAPTQELRARLMPKAAAFRLEDLLAELAACPPRPGESVTFEYLLLGGVNDSPEHARALGRIAADLKAKINLIAYNRVEGSPYAPPDRESILAFERELWKRGLTAVLRKRRGQDIEAACGQLRAARPGPASAGRI
ncbi:MAG: 23S rRNA (adenine(2503)-C(2))-methyltransferase RlmN [Deltaproteobacteria bacterium]|jgi:23S rRNA (adenine2503-C2)-methyltransferase|nr:23S rRNA (adenine(2503)-C(2))-methyltransferase RlmN [Deltaproteobacteria bacterium]